MPSNGNLAPLSWQHRSALAMVTWTVCLAVPSLFAVAPSVWAQTPSPTPTTLEHLPEPDEAAGTLPPEPDAIVLRSREFDIPFQMDPRSSARSVRLYVSTDHGQSWELSVTEPIHITSFHYQATSEGDYWFTTATDLERIDDPVKQLLPQRKIYIDTQGPQILLNGAADRNGSVIAKLKLVDVHQVATLRVLYATDVLREWKTFENRLIGPDGEIRITPKEDWQQISVHVTATDSINNASVESKNFRRPRIAAVPGPRYASTQLPSPQLPANAEYGSADAAKNVLDPSVAAQPSNRLRVQTIAGPGDPPSFLMGPSPQMRQHTPSIAPQHQPTIPNAQATNPGTPATNPGTPATNPGTPATNPGTPAASPAVTDSLQLPSMGLAATQTSRGVEVVPTPEPQRDPASPGTDDGDSAANVQELPAPSDAPKQSLAPSANNQAPEASTTPRVTPPITWGPQTWNPQPAPPIEKSDSPATSGSEAGNDDWQPEDSIPPPRKPRKSRTLQEAMRPLGDQPASDLFSDRDNTASNADKEPPSSRVNVRREQLDEADAFNKQQQMLFDRAQLAKSVPFRFSNSNRFSLEYELEAVANSGVESVELYGSVDAGRTWKRWGADPDVSSPFDIETKGEGVFAYRIVVLGNNGLASPRPLSGDNPDIAVIVDQTLPKIRITSARYGEADRTGSLVIRYECSDENLMTRPVSIAFSDSLDGPWTTIASGLRNDGLYVWPADPKLPPQIFLRVDATDQAGNQGSYLLEQPIATGGLAPRARILGFRPR